MSYISLIHQIEADLGKEYSENEVVDAIINAISPGLSIRSYLEGSAQLPLSRLCKIIHSHYKEGTATEIYQQLLVKTQDRKEDAMNFFIRLMDTRQKIIFACKEKDENELKYSSNLVKGLFRRAIETGLISENIHTFLFLYAQDPETTNEDLIQQMQHAVSAEAERKKKLGLITIQNKVNEVSAKDEKSAKSKTGPLIAAIGTLKTKMGTLKSEIRELKAPKQAGKMDSGNVKQKHATKKSQLAAILSSV